jgi:ATP-dependent Clp protease ATP-binding subunit ClpA
MFNRFAKEAREVALQAERLACELGSPAIEAEHLLLAVARRPASPAGRALAEAGLDGDALVLALDAETDRSLAAAGVALSRVELPPPGPSTTKPRWATSAKLALERALRVSLVRADKRIGPGHIVLGVLQAPTGTVPRALECAGIDRTELADRVAAVT